MCSNFEYLTSNHFVFTHLPVSDDRRNDRRRSGKYQSEYRRLTPAWYADGISKPVEGPNARYISNRIFADSAQNLFSETGATQWAWTWGQFIDHSIGLRQDSDEIIEVELDSNDPLESFTNVGKSLTVRRSAAAPGTGVKSAREQINTVSSQIDAWAVYEGDNKRLEWLREGPLDDDLDNNSALLLLPDNFLPAKSARGDAANSPDMEKAGMLFASPNPDDVQVVAGDVRANENIGLTATQTLFAREHNRIVALLPADWPEQKKFDAARKMVIATQQYITYSEFLPSLGLQLDQAKHNRRATPNVSNEFATVGYRAHSMVHGEIELSAAQGYYNESLLFELESQGIPIEKADNVVEIAVPLNIAHGNPNLVRKLGVGQIALGLAAEPQYKNDEQIDNQLRSVLFQLPSQMSSGGENCLDGESMHKCYKLINDLGVLDIMRGREHGVAPYNVLRVAYGLPAVENFTGITGEQTEEFPVDGSIDLADPINDPAILEFNALFDANGSAIALGSEEAEGEAVSGVRKSTLAARLKAIYKDVDAVDAFVGMVSEPHVVGSDFGELQYAIWKRQFENLRDADSNFYLWDAELSTLMNKLEPLGLTYKQSLADVVRNNTDLQADSVPDELFIASD